ncbi:MAG TPA: carboxy-S-adenosyl-L-methionine synthase CmoA [Desulfobulbus sp.]|nr:carboxy-S-adenosyl-L-methionine synthase CmoA [Desulfobulbus sp.]
MNSPEKTTSRDELYRTGRVREDFRFNEEVAEVFDDMLDRSIPFYGAVIDAMAEFLRLRLDRGATILDLGCATGTTLLSLARRLEELEVSLVGIDNAPAMLAKARRKAGMFSRGDVIEFRQADITTCDLSGADAIICNYTLQFIRPLLRQDFVQRLHDALPDGGVLILSEKVISHAPELNRQFIEMYHGFKRRQGYSELEIAAKREALENVLVPFSVDENAALLRRAGFSSQEIFFRWFNFASFVAIR